MKRLHELSEGFENWLQRPWIKVVACTLLFLLPALACTSAPGSTGAPAAAVAARAEVRREIANVNAGAGAADALPQLTDGGWHTLFDGERVAVDAAGEGWVRIDSCMLVYVFQHSSLMTATCPKSSYAGGNATCSLAGTAVYNNQCASQLVIETESARFTPHGTWFSVSYFPASGLTMLMVFDGVVSAQPVVNVDGGLMGTAGEVPSGHLWFTKSGVNSGPLQGLDARVPHPFYKVEHLLVALGMQEWWERMRLRAEVDTVPFPDFDLEGATTSAPPTATRRSATRVAPTATRRSPPTATRRPPPTVTPIPEPECLVNASSLNMRSGPGTNYAVLRTLKQGIAMRPVARSRDSTWLVVQTGGREGWVSADGRYTSCNIDITRLPVEAAPPTPKPPTPTRPVEPDIVFEPATAEVGPGGCVTLRWRVENVREVYFNGEGVAGISERRVCPRQDSVYRLRVVSSSGTTERTSVVKVVGVQAPSIRFWADRYDTYCWDVHWAVDNARAVYFEGNGVVGHDSQRVCTEYERGLTLRVIDLAGQEIIRTLDLDPYGSSSSRPAPVQLSPPSGSSFDHVPRTTTLSWRAVSGDPGYISYKVEIDCFNCCAMGRWCTDVGTTWQIERVTSTSFTFNWVGAQPGRWRVWALHPDGVDSEKSGWWEFNYVN